MAFPHPLPFGMLLKRARLARGLTQEALAARARVSTRAISDLERGINRAPRKETLRLLADALELAHDERARLEAAYHWSTRTGVMPAAALWDPSDALRPSLAGRAVELARLAQHLAGEGPPFLLLAGEPGMGKSRLLDEVRLQASTQGWTVLADGCHRQSGQEPYTPLLGALASYLRLLSRAQSRGALAGCAWLVRLLPELAEEQLLPNVPWTLPPEQERRLMFAAVERLLDNVAGPTGTLLVLDDLQWAGSDALDLLRILVRGAVKPSLRVIGSYRGTDVRPDVPLATLVADLAAAGLAAQLDLAPLVPAEAVALLTSLLGDREGEGGALVEQIVRRSGGVPFFLISYAQAVRQHPGAAPEAIPWTVAQSIRQRVAVLPEAARDLLGAAAVIGRHVPGALLQALDLQPERETVRALETTCHAWLLTEVAEGYQFPHDLIREVILADLSATRRRLLHRLVAQTLEQQPGEPPLAQLTYHWASAGEREKAAIALEQAGDHAVTRHAFAEAEGYFRDGLAQWTALGRVQEYAHLYGKLANALRFQDRYEEALEAFTQALEKYQTSGDQEGQWHTLAQIGWVHGDRGTLQEGLSQLEPALARLEPGRVSPGLAALYAALAFLSFGSGQYTKQLAFAEHAVRLAQALQDEALRTRAYHSVSIALTMLGRPQDSQPARMEAIRLAEQIGDLWTLSEALNGQSLWHLLRGDFAQSTAYSARACHAAEQLGWSSNIAYMWFWRGHTAFMRGEWTEARMQYEQAAEWGRESGGIWGVGYPAYGRGQLALAQGQQEEASAYFAAATALAERGHDLRLLRYIQRARAEAELLVGRPDAARARLAPLLDQSEQEELYVTLFLPFLAWATLDCGDSAEAELLLSTCLRRAQEQEARIVMPDALRIQARLEARRGHWADAERALEEALTLCQSMHYPYAEVKALYEYGQLCLQRDEPQQACERFEAALMICARLGEKLYAQHMEGTLTTKP